jgi:hypothetical protein
MAGCHSELNITQLREEDSERGWRSGRHPGQMVATFFSLPCSNRGARTFFIHSNYPPTLSPGCKIGSSDLQVVGGGHTSGSL